MANYWKNYLEDTVFICPDAPEKCSVNPSGFQWFDLRDQNEELILVKSLVAEKKLNEFIDEVKSNYSLTSNKISLVGFSQGCMIILQTGLKRKDKLNSLVGYSGKIINTEHLENNINAKPEIILMHGDKDLVVPIEFHLEAKDFFSKKKYNIQSKIFNNCEHRIPQEGSSLGLKFLKKNLY